MRDEWLDVYWQVIRKWRCETGHFAKQARFFAQAEGSVYFEELDMWTYHSLDPPQGQRRRLWRACANSTRWYARDPPRCQSYGCGLIITDEHQWHFDEARVSSSELGVDILKLGERMISLLVSEESEIVGKSQNQMTVSIHVLLRMRILWILVYAETSWH